MTISFKHKQPRDAFRVFQVCLLVAVYLLSSHFSLSHTHNHSTDLAPKLLAQYLSSIADHPDLMSDDVHHPGGCKLVAQASFPGVTVNACCIAASAGSHLPLWISLRSATPTKRLTRAPPAIT